MVLILAACTAPAHTAAPSVAPTPTPVPTPTPIAAAAEPCKPDQVTLTAGPVEGAAGTSYLTFRATLASGSPCQLVDWPSIVIKDGSNAVIATGPAEAGHDGEEAVLTTGLEYHIGWSSWCGEPPLRPLTAEIALIEGGSDVTLALPDSYSPSGCLGAATHVSVEPQL